jgi:hypothetical protein
MHRTGVNILNEGLMLNEFTVSGITPFGMQPARDVPRRAFNKAVPSLGARGNSNSAKMP